TAIYDEAKQTIDFSAWATVTNTTGAEWKDAELTLATGDPSPAPAAGAPARPGAAIRFQVPRHVHVGAGETIQVELMPARAAAADVASETRQADCRFDDRARQLHEKIEVRSRTTARPRSTRSCARSCTGGRAGRSRARTRRAPGRGRRCRSTGCGWRRARPRR